MNIALPRRPSALGVFLMSLIFLAPLTFTTTAISKGKESSVSQATQEAEFLQKVHLINQAEIKAGHLAQEKGQSQGVKNFGRTLVEDHQAADKKVTSLAEQQHIDLAKPPKSKGIEELQKNLATMQKTLTNLPANKFDKGFAQHMATAHKDAIDMVERSSKEFKDDSPFKALAQGLLPTLREHENIAKGLAEQGNVAH